MDPFLTDHQWSLLQPLMPPPSPVPSRGRPPLDDRLLLDAIFWKLSLGLAWDLLPTSFPSGATCYRRYRLWKHSGLLRQIFTVLFRDLFSRGAFDPRQAIADRQVRIDRLGRPWHIQFNPSFADTWQRRTAQLFYIAALMGYLK
jgi:transposase